MNYPLILSHIYKERVWGGNRFPSETPIGEDWVLSVRDGDQSVITNGIYAGKALADIVGNDFPILIKFIDSEEALSIQVHPDENVAALLGGDAKSEMWVILDAESESYIYYGVKADTDLEEFRSLILRGDDPTPYLNKVPVKDGDVYYIPGGTPHAIGPGIYLCEVQQNSDTTYRMYDYGRPRELHLHQAAMSVKKDIDKKCPYFDFDVVKGDCRLSGLSVMAVIKGSGTVDGYPIREGDCVYIPDGAEKYEVRGDIQFLNITF